MIIETILSPRELSALAQRDLRDTVCVVFDILRATTTFVTALQNGAEKIIPVCEIAEAVAVRRAQPEVLLAGERDGIKIRAAHSGGIDFDFGNSPREFMPERVRGKIIVSTTTNGTWALRACAGAGHVLAASFLNLTATADFLRAERASKILLVCAGTGEEEALEDVLAAGALIELLPAGSLDDGSQSARQTFLRLKADLPSAIGSSKNGRRLLKIPELHEDVAFCAQQDVYPLVAVMDSTGCLRRV